MMTNNNKKEKRFSKLLSTVEKEKVLPDNQFLAQLRNQSLEEFEAHSGESKDNLQKETNYIWRIIMKSRITKFAAVVIVCIIVIVGYNLFKGTPAWAIDQTIKALEKIHSGIAYGELAPENERTFDFKLYVKADPEKPLAFNGRVESGDAIGVIRDNIAYNYELGSREIYAYNLEETKGKAIGTKLWYEVTKNAPWVIPIAPTMLRAAKLLADDWQEVYKEDEITQRQCVFVTGSYQPLSASFFIVFDLETKLIVRAKYWTNPNREGTPNLNIRNIVYNVEIEDEIFDLEKTTGAMIINEKETKERYDLWRRAIELQKSKQYSEAIKVYQQIYEKYPNFIKTPEALCIIAILYHKMGKYDKAIEYTEKVHQQYSAPRYAILDAYRLGGLCYMKIDQDAEALKNLQNCLKLIDQWNGEGRDWQKYRELVENQIEEIKTKK